uniref:Serosal cuticle-related protein 2 n=1 Tax=Nilaparvata lugens TaxID=108931 RepID=A0A6G5SX57_NILLU|nr:serosal cuticle-related protein 2 [Nilaparvata lugens]
MSGSSWVTPFSVVTHILRRAIRRHAIWYLGQLLNALRVNHSLAKSLLLTLHCSPSLSHFYSPISTPFSVESLHLLAVRRPRSRSLRNKCPLALKSQHWFRKNSKFFTHNVPNLPGFDFDSVSPFCFGPFCVKSPVSNYADWFKTGSPLPNDLHVKEIFQNPVFLIMKSLENPAKFKLALAIDGVQSIFTDPNFKIFKDFLQTPIEKNALVFPPHQFFNTRLYKSQLDGVILPQIFNVGQLTKIASSFKHIPFVAFFEKSDFDIYHFDSIYDFGKFAVFPDFIEPVVESPVPVLIKNSIH